MVRRADVDRIDVPVLKVWSAARVIGSRRRLRLRLPAAEASIAELDPSNSGPGSTSQLFRRRPLLFHRHRRRRVGTWQALEVGEFDGDGNYLDDLNDDGVAEIATVTTPSTTSSTATPAARRPSSHGQGRQGGRFLDRSALSRRQPRMAEADREAVDPSGWSSPGYLAGWVAAKARVGEATRRSPSSRPTGACRGRGQKSASAAASGDCVAQPQVVQFQAPGVFLLRPAACL